MPLSSSDSATAFLDQYRKAEIITLTGLTPTLFHDVFVKYCGVNTPIPTPFELFLLFQWLKLYPVARASPFTLNHQGRIQRADFVRSFRRHYHKALFYLASVVDELQAVWDARWSPNNAIPHLFSHQVTGSVDTFPIVINRPIRNQEQYYNGKYGAHVLKVQAVCDNRGAIMWYSGVHKGTIHDNRLFQQNTPPINFLFRGERLLGDKAYVGLPTQVIAPFKKPHGAALSGLRAHFNQVHAWYRATVEHSFAYIKRFRILNGIYRGHITRSTNEIDAALKVIIHISTMYVREHPMRTHIDLNPLTMLSSTDSDSESDSEADSPREMPARRPVRPILPLAAIVPDPPAFDPAVGTGFTAANFRAGQRIEVWYADAFWPATCQMVDLHGTLTVRIIEADYSLGGMSPAHCRPAH